MTVEVKTRLSIDESDAAKALRKTSSGYKQLAKDASAAGSFIKNAMSTAAGVYVPKMVGGALSMAKSFFDVAASAQGSTKSFTGLYSMFRNIPFEKAAQEAKGMKNELWEMAVDLGKKPADAYASFQTLARAMGASTATEMAKARQQTEQLMVVADALGMEVGDLTGEFAMFAKAPRIMRGPMFDILRATGIFGKDLVTMNKNWSKLSESAKQGGLAKALEMQAGKLKSVPDDWEDQVNSIEAILKKGKEAIGQPILEAMMPIAKEFIGGLRGAMPELKAGGKAIGQTVARYLKIGVEYLKFGIGYAKSHSDEIKKRLQTAADFVKGAFDKALEVVKFIWAHKELIAGVVVGSKVASGVQSAVQTAGNVANAATSAFGGKAAGEGAGAVANMLRLLGGGSVLAGAGAVAAILAAVVAVVAAGYQAVKLAKDIAKGDDAHQNAVAQMETAQRLLNEGRLKEAQMMMHQAEYSVTKSRTTRGFGAEGADTATQIEAASSEANKIEGIYAAAINVYQNSTGQLGTSINDSGNATRRFMGELVETYNTATASHNVKMQAMAASILLQSESSRELLVQSGFNIAGGIEAMGLTITKAAAETGLWVKTKAPTGMRRGTVEVGALQIKQAASGAGATVNMSGGQTFNTKMDFKGDGDPDRIALVFRREMVKAALSRRSSRITGIFGSL